MKCYKPILIKYHKRDEDGNKITGEKHLMVRCGKCLACREEIAKEYTYRFMNEYKYFKYLYFITLTYEDDKLPRNAEGYETLDKKEITDYLKTININVKRHLPNEKYKYFTAGEYGDQTMRPHYHVSILCNNPKVAQLFVEKWHKGRIDFQAGDMRSVFYVIGYSNKKIGDNDSFYETNNIEKPFRKFSRGLGKTYYEENKNNLAGQYYGKLGNTRIALPNYYKNKLKGEDLVDIQELEKKAMENNDKLIEYYIKTYKENYTLFDYYNDKGLYNAHVKETLEQRERNYKAKYLMKKSRKKI